MVKGVDGVKQQKDEKWLKKSETVGLTFSLI